MRRLLLTTVLLAFASVMANAQMAKWAVKPGIYEKIEPFWENLYLVYQQGKVGIVDGTGNVVAPVEAQYVTGFYDGYALVLGKPNDGAKTPKPILGIVSKQGTYAKVSGEYFTIPTQEFVSEGLLTARNAGGNVCYLDINGKLSHEIKENGVVENVFPFSGGYSFYFTSDAKNRVRIIDKSFRQITYKIDSNEYVRYAANWLGGVFMLWNTSGKSFMLKIGENNNVAIEDKRFNKIKSLQLDYLGGYKDMTKAPESVTYDKMQRGRLLMTSTMQNNRYGYTYNGKVVLPCQFDKADSMYGNSAIVVLNGEYGLLTVGNTNGEFRAAAINPDMKFKKNENTNIAHRFSLTVPNFYDNVSVRVFATDHKELRANRVDVNTFEFQSPRVEEGDKRYDVEVGYEGLKLWEGSIYYRYELKKDPVTPTPNPSVNRNRVTDGGQTPTTPVKPTTPKKEERRHF